MNGAPNLEGYSLSEKTPQRYCCVKTLVPSGTIWYHLIPLWTSWNWIVVCTMSKTGISFLWLPVEIACAVLPTVEDILLLLFDFCWCIIATWLCGCPNNEIQIQIWVHEVHSHLQKFRAPVWKTCNNNLSIRLVQEWQGQAAGFMNVHDTFKKSFFWESVSRLTKFHSQTSPSSAHGGFLTTPQTSTSSPRVRPVPGLGVMPFWTSSMMPRDRQVSSNASGHF